MKTIKRLIYTVQPFGEGILFLLYLLLCYSVMALAVLWAVFTVTWDCLVRRWRESG
jgi:hypothetical protein